MLPFNPKEQILYEDNHLIIINKYVSQIVQGDKTGDEPLSESIKKYIKEKYQKPGNVYLGVVHRLDRPTSGIVIFAKTSKALTRLNKMLQDHTIKKTYRAIVKNPPPDIKKRLINHLYKNKKMNKSFIAKGEKNKAKEAILEYNLIGKSKNFHLLEIRLFTGRHHQIRVQLSHIGCPIKGDLKYGFPRSNKDAGISLHAYKIEFVHPVQKRLVSIVATSVSENDLWQSFKKV
jgi:23S rRNA pseudouridine1911/1915/1917 synthase